MQGFLEQDPDNLSLLADVADEALQLGDTEVALSAVRRLLELKPNDPASRLRLSSITLAEGNISESLAITGELMTEGIKDSAVLYNHAFALVSSGRFGEAKDILLSLYEQHAPIGDVVPLLLRCHHYLGELDEAIELALKHLQTSPQDRQVAGMLSLLYLDLEDFAKAEEWSQRALSEGSENLDALLAAGGVALAREEGQTAKELMFRAVAVRPQNGRAWTDRKSVV
jgi:Flp pilus assembly protein TadD